MNRVLIVASRALQTALRSEIASIANLELVTVEADDAWAIVASHDDVLTYAVLHAEAFGPRSNLSAPLLYDVISALRERRVPTAVLFSKVEDDDMKKAVFLSYIDLGIDLGERAEGTPEAVARIATSIRAVAATRVEPPADALEIGTLVKVDFHQNSQAEGEDNKPGTAYRMARWRSLLPLDGSVFSQDVRDVVQALSAFPLRLDVPWDPSERDGTPDWPSIRDVYRAFKDTPEALANLYSSKKPPIGRDEAIALLKPAEPRPKSDPAYARWWNAWRGGTVIPPALLIDGETGVGKSLMAEFVGFLLNPRSSELEAAFPAWRPEQIRQRHLPSRDRFVKFNGAALRSSDVADLMMGNAPGEWADMIDASVGQLARAAHGVFFLDEIGDMPLKSQAAILTFLDTREIRPKGVQPFFGFQHVIAATNRELSAAVADGRFRQDLLARFPLRLTVPPLRERSLSDRRRLLDFLAQDPAVNELTERGFTVTHFMPEAAAALVAADYRNGNFREFAERVHESIRRAKRRLSWIVAIDDVPPAQREIHHGES